MSYSIIETIIFFYGISWVYKRFIKGKNNNEISKTINEIIDSIKSEFNRNFKKTSTTNKSTDQMYEEETKRKYSDSYEDALTLYKAGVITKEELKDFKR